MVHPVMCRMISEIGKVQTVVKTREDARVRSGEQCEGLQQLQARVSTKWSPINSFFSSQILIFHQYSVSKIHFYHTIIQDSQAWSCRRPGQCTQVYDSIRVRKNGQKRDELQAIVRDELQTGERVG